MNKFSRNLFGVVGNQSAIPGINPKIGFIPTNRDGGIMRIQDAAPLWKGLSTPKMQYDAYNYCSPLASVINRLAECDINGIPEVLRKKGKGANDYADGEYSVKMNALFARPNPLQTWYSFRAQQVVYKKIFGFCPVMPINPIGFTAPEDAYQMWNLPPWCFDVESTKQLLRQTGIKGMVKHWVVNILGERIEIPADKIIILRDSFMDDPDKDFLLPKSRLCGLDMSVSNICAALEADNVLLRKKGPLGAWTHDAAATKDSVAGYMPLSKTEKEQVQNDLNQYGLNYDQYQYVVSRTALKWQSTSYNVSELGTKETLVAGTKEICHTFNYSYTLLEESESTFSANGARAHVSLYQNNVIPANMRDFADYENYFGATKNNCKFVADFSWLPILQPDKLLEAQTQKAKNEALKFEYDNGLIKKNEWLQALGRDTIKDGDLYIGDASTEALAVKFGVGGTAALIQVLTSPLKPPVKRITLISLFGLSEAVANQMAPDLTPEEIAAEEAAKQANNDPNEDKDKGKKEDPIKE